MSSPNALHHFPVEEGKTARSFSFMGYYNELLPRRPFDFADSKDIAELSPSFSSITAGSSFDDDSFSGMENSIVDDKEVSHEIRDDVKEEAFDYMYYKHSSENEYWNHLFDEEQKEWQSASSLKEKNIPMSLIFVSQKDRSLNLVREQDETRDAYDELEDSKDDDENLCKTTKQNEDESIDKLVYFYQNRLLKKMLNTMGRTKAQMQKKVK